MIETAKTVKIHRKVTAYNEHDAITVVIGDLHLSCDLVNDRQIALAKMLADNHGAEFLFDERFAERVKSAQARIKLGVERE